MISITKWNYCGVEMLIWIQVSEALFFPGTFLYPLFVALPSQRSPRNLAISPNFCHMNLVWVSQTIQQSPHKVRQRGGKGVAIFVSKILQHMTKFYYKVYNTLFMHSVNILVILGLWWVLPGTLKLYLQIEFLVLTIWSEQMMHKQASLLSSNTWEDKWNSGSKFWAIIHIETTPNGYPYSVSTYFTVYKQQSLSGE